MIPAPEEARNLLGEYSQGEFHRKHGASLTNLPQAASEKRLHAALPCRGGIWIVDRSSDSGKVV